jgi:hypothetical protein
MFGLASIYYLFFDSNHLLAKPEFHTQLPLYSLAIFLQSFCAPLFANLQEKSANLSICTRRKAALWYAKLPSHSRLTARIIVGTAIAHVVQNVL